MSIAQYADDLPDKTLMRINEVFAGHPSIEKVALYGSRAKGSFRAASDIDLTIFGNVDWRELQEIEWQLDDLLLPYKIDLSLYGYIDKQALREHTQRVGEVICPETRSINRRRSQSREIRSHQRLPAYK